MLIIAQVLKGKWLKISDLLIHKQQTCKWSWQDRKKNSPLSEPTWLQDLEYSARSQPKKKVMLLLLQAYFRSFAL